MDQAGEILKFNFSSDKFSGQGGNLFSVYLINRVNLCLTQLESIRMEVEQNQLEGQPTKDMSEIFLKYKQWYRDGDSRIIFDSRELRILSSALDFKTAEENAIFDNPDEIRKVLFLLSEKWKDYFLFGLFRSYLRNWRNSNITSFNNLGTFILEKINNYKGTRRPLLNLKANYKYFNIQKGDYELGAMLALKKIPLSDVTDYLSVADQWITYSYFTGVIEGYFERSKEDFDQQLEEIAKALDAHNGQTKGTMVSKIILSKIIIHTSKADEHLQDRVKDIAFNLIGDPGIENNWRSFEGTSTQDIQLINKARIILNEWIIRQFINVFFEKCINDYRRKKFWLKYSNRISRFKVFGPHSVKKQLKKDERISAYVEGRFQAVDSKRTISAFMFSMEGHKLIEFSDPGYAFYAYKLGNDKAPNFETKKLSSVDEFRDGSKPQLMKRSGVYVSEIQDEGKLNHKDGVLPWEEIFEYWITEKVGVNVKMGNK